MRSRWQEPAAFFSAAALLLAVSALPIASLLTEAAFGPRSTAAVLFRASTWALFGRSILLASTVTGAALLVGVPLGFLLGRGDLPGRSACWLLHGFPMFLPPFLLGLGWFQLLGRQGPLGSETASSFLFGPGGAVFVLTLAFTPIVTTLTALALQGMDPSYEEAARTVAHPWRVATRILLPATWPAAALGGIVVFALAFSELGVPMLLRVRVYPVAVFARLGGVDYAPGEAFALVLPLLAVALGLLLTERWVGKRRPLTVRGLRLSHEPILLGIWRKPATGLVWAFTFLGLLPLGALFQRALLGRGFLQVGHWFGSSISDSLLTAAAAATVLTGTGLVLGHATARLRRGAGALDGLALLAFVIPATALGVGLIQVWNHRAVSMVYASAAILVVGYAARYSILGLRPLAVAVGQGPPSLEEAAAVAGAGYFRRLLRIVAPVHVRALAATWLLIAVFCLRDLETSVLYYPPGKEPLAVRIFTLEANGPEPVVAALACTLVALTGVVVGIGLLVLRARQSS